ncbi:hypothetical protein PVT68_02230 [Microbulbifer bruguierae]|uniref:Zinc-finger domain-containing protein n=1 Tax=Microbulbifer bruguierae TaxID=3029061 RepID=A0ABY8NDY2_9GAMM|nr:hypothetical protein [Microbulbifer bruguierae]WGL17130.1 hypothetical protein PVT68_02230 [Microbulbifer bruguierae]
MSRKEQMALKIHIMVCRGCRNFGDQMTALRSFSKSYSKARASTDHNAGDKNEP